MYPLSILYLSGIQYKTDEHNYLGKKSRETSETAGKIGRYCKLSGVQMPLHKNSAGYELLK